MVRVHFPFNLFKFSSNDRCQEQDQLLDELSSSVNRQHHISLQINDELDVHHGLLEGLDSDLDRTDSRLRTARRKLDTFAQGVKENGEWISDF